MNPYAWLRRRLAGTRNADEDVTPEAAYKGLVVVIPTRNRARLAVNAIRSVFGQSAPDARILVSDNSTSSEEAAALARYCGGVAGSRLAYVRPPESMPMTQHWNWIMERALADYDANHVTFLTDRMVFKPGALAELAGILRRRPGWLLSYMHDRVDDDVRPVTVFRQPWTGKLMEVSAARLLYLASQSHYEDIFPRMLNCVAPRPLLEKLRARFGGVFGSISPDFNFGFRVLEVEDSILYYDKALLVHYALDRSNGASMTRGEQTPDHVDFVRSLGAVKMNHAAPIPEITTTYNAVAHEYCVARREFGGAKFPELDKAKYMGVLWAEIPRLADAGARERARELLRAHGWTPPEEQAPAAGPEPMPLWRKALSPTRVAGKVRWELVGKARGANGHAGNGHAPETFETPEQALERAVGRQRKPARKLPERERLLGVR